MTSLTLTLVLQGLLAVAALDSSETAGGAPVIERLTPAVHQALERVREALQTLEPPQADTEEPPTDNEEPAVPAGQADEELLALLQHEGYASAEVMHPGVIAFKMQGLHVLLLAYADGSLQLRMTMSGGDYTLAQVNEWNLWNRLSKSYLTSRGDLVLESDLSSRGADFPQRLAEFLDQFTLSLNDFRAMLRSGAQPGGLRPAR